MYTELGSVRANVSTGTLEIDHFPPHKTQQVYTYHVVRPDIVTKCPQGSATQPDQISDYLPWLVFTKRPVDALVGWTWAGSGKREFEWVEDEV